MINNAIPGFLVFSSDNSFFVYMNPREVHGLINVFVYESSMDTRVVEGISFTASSLAELEKVLRTLRKSDNQILHVQVSPETWNSFEPELTSKNLFFTGGA